MNNLELTVGPKTRFFNLFRRLFKVSICERWLANRTLNKSANSLWARLIPQNYLYKRPSVRCVNRFGINYSLDISDHMEHAIYFGCKDPGFEELFRLAKEKQVLVDVGVNLGFVSLSLARLCPKSKIIGFEPDPKNFQKAAKNLALNSFDNLVIVNKGLGEKYGKVKLYKVNESNEGMNRILESADVINNDYAFDEIEIVRLDDFAIDHELKGIDLIKIDVEGYELKVLKGATNILSTATPTLFIELDDNNLRVQNDSAESLISFIRQFEYRIYRAEDKKEVTVDADFSNCHFDIVCDRLTDQ